MNQSICCNLYNIRQISGVLLADVFAFEMPGLVGITLDSYLYGVVAVLAINRIYGSGQALLLLTVNGVEQVGLDG